MCSSLNLNRENLDFIDFLSSDIGSQIFRENMLSIHIETGNIFYHDYNTGKSIYEFLMRQQDNTKKKKKLNKKINLIFLQTQILNICSINLITICYLEIYQLFQLGIQKFLKTKLF